MARTTTLQVSHTGWTELTASNVSAITFQVQSTGHIMVKATSGAAPTDADGALRYNVGQGEANRKLLDLFPGVTGPTRLFAKAPAPVTVMVSHA